MSLWIITLGFVVLFVELARRVKRAMPFTAKAFVIDGDTIWVRGNLRVRLYGIDAPEAGQSQGETAWKALKRQIGGRLVEIHPRGRDKYGRMIAIVKSGPDDMSAWMVENGYAKAAYPAHAYLRLERAARRERRGFWAHSGGVQDAAAFRHQRRLSQA